MGPYIVGMISIVCISTLALVYVLRKNNLLNISMVAAIAVSSIIICLVIPFVFSNFNRVGLSLVLSLLITILIYITVILVVSVTISLFITDKKVKELWDRAKNSKLLQSIGRMVTGLSDLIKEKRRKPEMDVLTELEVGRTEATAAGTQEMDVSDVNENLYNNDPVVVQEVPEDDLPSEFVETGLQSVEAADENILEKSVDTEQIIDKMGIENVNEDILETDIFYEDDSISQEEPQCDNDVIVAEINEEEKAIDEAEAAAEEYESSVDYFNQQYFGEDVGAEDSTVEDDIAGQNIDTADVLNIITELNEKTEENTAVEEELKVFEREIPEEISDETSEAVEIPDQLIVESQQEIDPGVEDINDEIELIPEPIEMVDSTSEANDIVSDELISPDPGEDIIKDSLNGDTWSLQTGQSIDNIYNVEDSTEFDIKREPDVNSYIDEAFKLKECGDYEGAILHYMYALEKEPEKDAVFWIVLDTCVLYKELGQVELAREILQNYVTNFGDVMNLSVRTEIERNLSSN